MAKISVEILPWLSQTVLPGHSGRLLLEVEIQGSRIRDLLEALAASYPSFAARVYDTQRCDTTDLVEIAVNGRMLGYSDTLDTPIEEGDTVMLLPAYGGG